MPPSLSPAPHLLAPQPLAPALLAELSARALAAAHHSYAPYSRFRVGAAILLTEPHEGHIATGCNIENASFRLTTCAEQAAIASAVGTLGPAVRLRAVAVANLNQAASMPCGACRQTLLEFSPDPAAVTVLFPGEPDGTGLPVPQSCTLADLLPAAFRLRPDPCAPYPLQP